MEEILNTRRLFVVILGLGLFIMAARSVTDPDVWWHLRTGQLILQNRAIFHSDPYSFTRLGRTWIDHEWLSQIVIFGLYRVAGWGGLIAAFAVVIAATYWTVFQRSPGRPYVAGAMTAWGAVASIPCWGVRPQMLTLLLASVFLLILERSYQKPGVLWLTPALMLLWVNLHAGYAIGLAFLLIILAGDMLDAAFGDRKLASLGGRVRQLTLTLAACVAVVPLNPYGIRMFRYPLETLRSRTMLAYIGEWHSPDFHQSRYWPALLLMLATLALPAISPRKLRPRELLLLSATMYAGLRSVRHIPIYVLVAVPVLSAMLQACLDVRKPGWLDSAATLTRARMLINGVLLASFLVFVVLRFEFVIRNQPTVEAREFPSAAASFLSQDRPPGPLFNHYNWGGYFIWRLYPEYTVFIDGRADVYGDAFLDDFTSVYYIRGRNWRAAFEQWGIRTVILPPDAPLVAALRASADWKPVFSDRQVVVLSQAQTGLR